MVPPRRTLRTPRCPTAGSSPPRPLPGGDAQTDAPIIVGNDAGGPPASNRVDINMGVTPWKFLVGKDPTGAQAPTFDDSTWADVGIPHTWNDADTFVNGESGGAQMVGGTNWYRKHLTLDAAYAGRKILIEFEGVHVGAQVYVNGTFMPGNSAVAANAQATHVVGFIPFVLDITNLVTFGGADNVVAVRVGMNGGGVQSDGGLQSGAFFEDPGFSEVFRFGQEDGGIFRPVYMHITDPIHVPQNVYAVLNTWGTYVGTMTASATSATVKIQTNVQNEGTTDANVTVTTEVVDATGKIVVSDDVTNVVPAGKPPVLFEDVATVPNPTLWYPNNSPYGTPYMYRVWHVVQVNGAIVDAVQSPLGIRTITWNENFPIINGHPMYLQGASGRYDATRRSGTAVPEEQLEWRRLLQLYRQSRQKGGTCGGPGHSGAPEPGVRERLRRARGHDRPAERGRRRRVLRRGTRRSDEFARTAPRRPEDTEGGASPRHDHPRPEPPVDPLLGGGQRADRPRLRPAAASGRQPVGPDRSACPSRPDPEPRRRAHPRMHADRVRDGSEDPRIHEQLRRGALKYWGRQSARYAYDYEIAFVAEFLDNWRRSRNSAAFGIAQWYLAETPGEAGSFLEGPSGPQVRSFGSSMMDFNRIPKLLYYAYQAAWTPYATKPVVALAHHWNRTGAVTVNAFSNCPKVRLSINGTAVTPDQAPNPVGTSTQVASDLTENSTVLPMEVTWKNVTWAAGTLEADCLDASGQIVAGASDQRVTAGAADHIVLSVAPPVVRPDGNAFQIQANGTDAAFVLATVVDAKGNWVPTASNLVTFAVSGPGTYRGGSDQLVTANQPQTYHAPGDPELQAEGGMCKVAVKAQFAPGTVTVTASSPGLTSGSTTFTVYPVTP